MEQALGRQKGGFQSNPFGGGRIEHLMCRRYLEAAEKLRVECEGMKQNVGIGKLGSRRCSVVALQSLTVPSKYTTDLLI